MNDYVIVVCNVETNEFFISPKHDSFDLENFVPCTHYFPCKVGRNREITLETAEDVINFFYDAKNGYTNITDSDLVLDILTRP